MTTTKEAKNTKLKGNAMGLLSNLFLTIMISLVLLTPFNAAIASKNIDHSLYADLLGQYVADGVVDYKGFKEKESQLDNYLDMLATVDADKLGSREKKAYYINLYNAATIKLILTKYPVISSIKELGSILKSPWKRKIVKIKAGKVSLDHIEHEILRPTFQDPRIHFAVNCASKSCPPLLSKPYEASVIDDQLDSVAKAFINDSKFNHLEGQTLYVSSIFKWYGSDFKNGVVAFFEQYANETLKKQIVNNRSKITVNYLDYDWSLNGR